MQRARLHFWRSLSAFGGEGPWKDSSAKFVCIFRRTLSAKRAPFVCICRQSLSAKSRRFSVPWAFPFLALKRFICFLDKPCLQANISLSAFADKPCLHNRGRLRVPWTFPPPTFEIADKSADKSADKVCLDSCLTNLFKNADARAAKIVQKMQTNLVYQSCRQSLSTLDKVCLSWIWRWHFE